ncbi:MAG: NAD+ synthase [Phycisphaerales bacterium]
MRLGLAQINPTIGDLDGNAALIASYIERARGEQCDLVVFPELALTGYPPKDLLLSPAFVRAAAAAAKELGHEHSKGITVVFGCPLPLDDHARRLSNSLLAYRDGELLAYYDKRLLPTYDVFDENRYFEPGNKPVIIEVAGVRVGLSICEDLWRGQDVGFAERYLRSPDPVAELVSPPDGSPGAQLIINPSASPFVLGKGQRHRNLLMRHAVHHKVYIAAVNQVGGNDELVFDGHAAVYSPESFLYAAAPGFQEHLLVAEVPVEQHATTVRMTTATAEIQETVTELTSVQDPLVSAMKEDLLFRALVLGIRDYCRKTGFKSAVLGLSGGIDSALVAVLAAAAMGPTNVTGLLMPSQYSSPGSVSDAEDLAKRLGIHTNMLPIQPALAAFEATLAKMFAGREPDVTEENLQSRIRGTLQMAVSNKFGHILFTTGNKSELAVGYCTLYGDMNGGLAVISDVLKTQVYALSRWINAHWRVLGIENLAGPPIPDASITKAPSAELRPNQTDQDSLPPYDVLDEIIERYVELRESPAEIAAAMPQHVGAVRRAVRLIDLAEYKRKQAPIGLKVTGVAFGSGRRMPIAQGYRGDRTI